MSGIAHVLLEMDYNVSGSDVEPNSITRKLEEMGARLYAGHSASNLPPGAKALVYSSSISKDNPELKEARRRKIIIAHRAELLGELFNGRKGVAVTGTHGKTTTTSLVSVMLKNAGFDPTVIIGGEVASLKGNARLGSGEYIVAEADESDSSFLRLKPFYTVVTNIEKEHLDHFRTLGRIRTAYRSFIDNTKKGGTVFYNIGDRNLKKLAGNYKGRKRSFGFSKDADIYPVDIRMEGFNTSFMCVCDGKALGKVSLKIPGAHNVLNALASILVGLEAGLNFRDIARYIKDFTGAKRRFELRVHTGGVMLIDDYAHHPTEIQAVLAASGSLKKKRLIAVFQPHRYSRTKFFAADFGKSFKKTDKLILTDIYAASEKAIKDVSVRSIYAEAKKNGLKDVTILKKTEVAGYLMNIKRKGDMIIVMGAGDIKKVADELCGRLLAEKRIDGKTIKKLRHVVRGKIKVNEPLSSHTSFKIGGAAGIWFEPRDMKDLRRAVIFAKNNKVPSFIIGNGSNILARDNGFNGMVINLASDYFKQVKLTGASVRVGGGFSLPKLVRLCCERGLGGLESMVGIPGTIGGAIYMNAGGWTNPIFRNIGESITSLKVIGRDGHTKTLKKYDIKFGYRSSGLENYVILEAVLKLKKSSSEMLVSSAGRFLKMKREKQVLDIPSAGCIFKNPPGCQFTCAQMIDMLGLKGKRMGGAEVSTRHANFIVNTGGAGSKDVLDLAELIRTRVRENYGVELEMEVKVI